MSIQGEDLTDTANIPLPGLPEPKKDERKMEQLLGDLKMCAGILLGDLKMCAPTHKHMDWVSRRTFSIMCCVNAFSVKSECTLAYCPDCFEKREDVWRDEDKKKRRGGRKKEQVTQTTGLASEPCGNHKIWDLRELTILEDKKYLASARKDTAGVEFVAKTCWDCGVWF